MERFRDMETMKALMMAAGLTLGLGASPLAAADGEALQFDIGVYAASGKVMRAWSCEALVGYLESAMSEALDQEVELELRLSDSYAQGVNDVTQGVVQFGRFPNIPSKWVLSHHISDAIADAWLVALRKVDPEGVMRGIAAGSAQSSGCAEHYAVASGTEQEGSTL